MAASDQRSCLEETTWSRVGIAGAGDEEGAEVRAWQPASVKVAKRADNRSGRWRAAGMLRVPLFEKGGTCQ